MADLHFHGIELLAGIRWPLDEAELRREIVDPGVGLRRLHLELLGHRCCHLHKARRPIAGDERVFLIELCFLEAGDQRFAAPYFLEADEIGVNLVELGGGPFQLLV